MTTVFESERLRARPFVLDDAAALFTMYGDPEVTEFLPEIAVTTLEEQEKRTVELLERVKMYKGGLGAWAFERKDEPGAIGMVLLKNLPFTRNDFSDDIEVGWHLARACWGRGYATEIGAAAIAYGFNDLGLDEVYAVVKPDNARSIAVVERLRMSPLGTTKTYYAGEELLRFRVERGTWESPSPPHVP